MALLDRLEMSSDAGNKSGHLTRLQWAIAVCVRVLLKVRSSNKHPTATRHTSHGTTAGDGPGAKGLSQGRLSSKSAVKEKVADTDTSCINEIA